MLRMDFFFFFRSMVTQIIFCLGGENVPLIKGPPIEKNGIFVKEIYASGYFVAWAIYTSYTD